MVAVGVGDDGQLDGLRADGTIGGPPQVLAPGTSRLSVTPAGPGTLVVAVSTGLPPDPGALSSQIVDGTVPLAHAPTARVVAFDFVEPPR